MLIQPKVRGFICTTAHPAGCEEAVRQQINYVTLNGQFSTNQKNVLIIGASTGYGLASRISAAFGGGANTLGVFFERPAEDKRTATAGWYNTAAFEKFAHAKNMYAKSINGDAFSHAIKQQTLDLIKKDFGKVDLIIYSLASPRRIHPDSGQVFNSVLKPIGQSFKGKTVDPMRGEVKEILLEPATESDIADTVAVMGGEDWAQWIDLLQKENVLADGITTIAYTYIGPVLTYPIYKDGTIGRAKEDLQKTANYLQEKLKSLHGKALISVNKALVTQASSAIPVVPLYISLLYKFMKEQGTHEGCIEQMTRLFQSHLYGKNAPALDEQGRIRLDDREMELNIQQKIKALWPVINTENLTELSDIQGYCDEFYRLFGFYFSNINYSNEVNPDIIIPSLLV